MTTTGKLGTAILQGIISSISQDQNALDKLAKSIYARRQSATDIAPSLRLIACIQSEESKSRLRNVFKGCHYQPEILVGNNLLGAQQGDVILLCCEPSAMDKIFDSQEMKQALEGKDLISVLGGVTVEDIWAATSRDNRLFGSVNSVIRAIPNIAAATRNSMTVIQAPVPDHMQQFMTCFFSMIGKICIVSEAEFDIATTICASGPAFITEIVYGLLDGAVNAGMDAKVALDMIAYMVRGTSQLLVEGQDPSVIRRTVMTPGGGTEVGINVLAAANTRLTWAEVVRKSTKHNVQKALKLRNSRG
jgi:pyrroline-5-carboxylate reductase